MGGVSKVFVVQVNPPLASYIFCDGCFKEVSKILGVKLKKLRWNFQLVGCQVWRTNSARRNSNTHGSAQRRRCCRSRLGVAQLPGSSYARVQPLTFGFFEWFLAYFGLQKMLRPQNHL